MPNRKTPASANAAVDLPQLVQAGVAELRPHDGALLLMHFAFRGLVVKADVFLATQGLTRVHHRILYAVARAEGISIGQLVTLLGVSKQALHRPLKHLQEAGLVGVERDAVEHRSKQLRLTTEGARIERQASDFERRAMEAALRTVSPAERLAWRRVMTVLAKMA